jgi:hypothetical protein
MTGLPARYHADYYLAHRRPFRDILMEPFGKYIFCVVGRDTTEYPA